jgi:hypothetical protein
MCELNGIHTLTFISKNDYSADFCCSCFDFDYCSADSGYCSDCYSDFGFGCFYFDAGCS